MGMTILCFAVSRRAVCHIGVGFLLFIDSKGNAKTSMHSKQLEVCAFYVCINIIKNINHGKTTFC